MIYITQLIYIHPNKVSDFLEFERKAFALMAQYNGKIIQRIRPDAACFIEGEKEKPYEIHIVSFPDESDLQAYLADDNRQAIKHLKDKSVKSILMFKGQTE